MATFDRILQLKLVTDVGNINAQVTGVTSKISAMGTALKTSLKMGAIGVAADAVLALGDAVGTGMSDAREAKDVLTNLQKTIAGVGVDADTAMDAVAKLGDTALDLGFDDTDATKAFDKFLTKTGSVDESAALVMKSFDLARGKAVDLATAAGEIDTIYNGSAKALNDYGLAGVDGMAAVDAAMLTSTGKAQAWADDSSHQMEIVSGKAGELFETAGSSITTAIDTTIVPAITDTLIPAIDSIWTTVQPGLQDLADALGPKLGEIFAKLGELWTAAAPYVQTFVDIVSPLIEAFKIATGLAFDAVGQALQLVIDLLNGDFSGAWEDVKALVGTLVDTIATAVGGIEGVILNVVPAITDAAMKIGAGILGGIMKIVGGLTDGVVGEFRNALQGIIDIWNNFSMPPFDINIPGVSVPNPLGGDFQVIPTTTVRLWGQLDFPDFHLAAGGLVTRPMHALVGEAGPEAVIPLERLGGLGGDTYNLTVQVAPTADPYAVGQAIVRAIRAFESRAGKSWRR